LITKFEDLCAEEDKRYRSDSRYDFGFTLRNKIRVTDRIRNSDIGFTLRNKTRVTDRIRNSDFGFTL